MSKVVKHIYTDSTFTAEWSELMDGKWPYGDKDKVEFIHNEPLYKNKGDE